MYYCTWKSTGLARSSHCNFQLVHDLTSDGTTVDYLPKHIHQGTLQQLLKKNLGNVGCLAVLPAKHSGWRESTPERETGSTGKVQR